MRSRLVRASCLPRLRGAVAAGAAWGVVARGASEWRDADRLDTRAFMEDTDGRIGFFFRTCLIDVIQDGPEGRLRGRRHSSGRLLADHQRQDQDGRVRIPRGVLVQRGFIEALST